MTVLDTHAWLWWLDSPERLGERARAEIETAEAIGVPTVACFELGRLVARGRISLDQPLHTWIRRALARPSVEEIPLTAEMAVAAAELSDTDFPGDPADRMIYATARTLGALLVSRDREISRFDPARVAW